MSRSPTLKYAFRSTTFGASPRGLVTDPDRDDIPTKHLYEYNFDNELAKPDVSAKQFVSLSKAIERINTMTHKPQKAFSAKNSYNVQSRFMDTAKEVSKLREDAA